MIFAITGLLLAALTAAPANVKGKWEGTLSGTAEDGTTRTDSAVLILDQKDTTITGSLGGSETDQHPITKGTIDGDKVVLLARHDTNGREFRLELTIKGDEMAGIVVSGTLKGTVAIERKKQ